MDKFKSRIQLLSLLSIFFIYSAIKELISNNMSGFIIWIMISLLYIISLTILYFIIKKGQKEKKI